MQRHAPPPRGSAVDYERRAREQELLAREALAALKQERKDRLADAATAGKMTAGLMYNMRRAVRELQEENEQLRQQQQQVRVQPLTIQRVNTSMSTGDPAGTGCKPPAHSPAGSYRQLLGDAPHHGTYPMLPVDVTRSTLAGGPRTTAPPIPAMNVASPTTSGGYGLDGTMPAAAGATARRVSSGGARPPASSIARVHTTQRPSGSGVLASSDPERRRTSSKALSPRVARQQHPQPLPQHASSSTVDSGVFPPDTARDRGLRHGVVDRIHDILGLAVSSPRGHDQPRRDVGAQTRQQTHAAAAQTPRAPSLDGRVHHMHTPRGEVAAMPAPAPPVRYISEQIVCSPAPAPAPQQQRGSAAAPPPLIPTGIAGHDASADRAVVELLEGFASQSGLGGTRMAAAAAGVGAIPPPLDPATYKEVGRLLRQLLVDVTPRDLHIRRAGGSAAGAPPSPEALASHASHASQCTTCGGVGSPRSVDGGGETPDPPSLLADGVPGHSSIRTLMALYELAAARVNPGGRQMRKAQPSTTPAGASGGVDADAGADTDTPPPVSTAPEHEPPHGHGCVAEDEEGAPSATASATTSDYAPSVLHSTSGPPGVPHHTPVPTPALAGRPEDDPLVGRGGSGVPHTPLDDGLLLRGGGGGGSGGAIQAAVIQHLLATTAANHHDAQLAPSSASSSTFMEAPAPVDNAWVSPVRRGRGGDAGGEAADAASDCGSSDTSLPSVPVSDMTLLSLREYASRLASASPQRRTASLL